MALVPVAMISLCLLITLKSSIVQSNARCFSFFKLVISSWSNTTSCRNLVIRCLSSLSEAFACLKASCCRNLNSFCDLRFCSRRRCSFISHAKYLDIDYLHASLPLLRLPLLVCHARDPPGMWRKPLNSYQIVHRKCWDLGFDGSELSAIIMSYKWNT
jgi:hypothetical protein